MLMGKHSFVFLWDETTVKSETKGITVLKIFLLVFLKMIFKTSVVEREREGRGKGDK